MIVVMKFSVTERVLRMLGFIISVIVGVVLILMVWHGLHLALLRTYSFIWIVAPQLIAGVVFLLVIRHNKHVLKSVQSREQALEASRQRFAHVYERSPVPYVNIDRDGDIVMSNLAAMRLLGLSGKRLQGKALVDFFIAKNESAMTILISKLTNHTPLSDIEIQIEDAKGGRHWVLFSVFEFADDGERLVSLLDITKQKEIEAAKTEFVTLASHQLRTPVASVRWNLELLEASGDITHTPEQQQYYTKINRNVERLVSLISDFLNVSKLELGTFATHPSKIELHEFFAETLDELDEIITQKGIVVTTEFDERVDLITVDKRLLHIVASNLVSNAVKYTPTEGLVTVGYAIDGDALTLTVTDTGIGIPEDERGELFNKFYRASNAQIHETEGTGLGLYLVKKAVVMMEGEIAFETTLDVGTTFTVTLPYRSS